MDNVRVLARVRFRRAGPGNHWCDALVDPAVVADARAVIEAAQGPLAAFDLVEPPPAEAAPPEKAADPPESSLPPPGPARFEADDDDWQPVVPPPDWWPIPATRAWEPH